MKLRIALPSLLAFCLVTLPAAAQVLYNNGPINGTIDGWNTNFGSEVSDTFTLSNPSTLTGLSFGVWLYPGDLVLSVEVQVTSSEFGGTLYTDQVINLTDSGCTQNQYGFNVCTASGSFGTPLNLTSGTYWLNLDNSVVNDDPAYWDENSGPSQASENSVGTIPSEAFTLYGGSSSGTTPEPGSIVLFASGIIGVFGILHRKML